MTSNAVLAFWAVSFLMVITPGMDWAFAISAGIRGRFVVPAVLGMLGGHLLATLVVAAGIGALVMQIPYALTALTLVGAGYLLWLGANMLLKAAAPTSSADAGLDTGSGWALKGLCVSGLNPKVLLMFLALLPQFVDPASHWPIPGQVIALGTLHALSCLAVYLSVGFGARAVLRANPKAALWVSRVSGAAMIAIALGLAFERWLAL